MVADRGYFEQIVQQAREQLSHTAFAAAWEKGRATPLEDVVTEAQTLADAAASPDEPDDTASGCAEDTGEGSVLSLREREVLRLIAHGHSNAMVAQMLAISPRTVSTHAAHILGKLGLATRSELIAFAHREGFA
jgi:DNA-binding NarL/FixJ family response regulator